MSVQGVSAGGSGARAARVPEEFDYRITWRSSSAVPGAHPSRRTGSGGDFAGHISLLQTTDPRRFDVLATLRDPQRSLRLKTFRQPGTIPVTVVLDVSASVPAAAGGNVDVVADFVASAGFSAARTGDSFGVIACDERVRRDLLLPHTRRRGAGIAYGQRLRTLAATGRGADALTQAVNYLPRQRGLVFLVSDFHLPAARLDRLLAALGRHDVVPVPVWSEAERRLPPFGLVRLRDAEGGGERLLALRPGLARRIRDAVDAHRERVLGQFRRHGRRPLMLGDTYAARTVTRYFHG